MSFKSWFESRERERERERESQLNPAGGSEFQVRGTVIIWAFFRLCAARAQASAYNKSQAGSSITFDVEFSQPCSGFDYLGHYKRHWLIEWFIYSFNYWLAYLFVFFKRFYEVKCRISCTSQSPGLCVCALHVFLLKRFLYCPIAEEFSTKATNATVSTDRLLIFTVIMTMINTEVGLVLIWSNSVL